jgi:hypothetical protein
MGVMVLIALAIVSAALWHRYTSRFAEATLGATLTTVGVFHFIAFLYSGYLDKFFLIALFTSTLVALLLSIVVGLPIRARRKRGELE